jgi:hypothetical protein
MIAALLRLVLTVLFSITGTAKVLRIPTMRRNAEHLNFTQRQFQAIGVLELLGVAGIAAGRQQSAVEIGATAGLFGLMLGATASHAVRGDGAVKVATPALVAGTLAAFAALTN